MKAYPPTSAVDLVLSLLPVSYTYTKVTWHQRRLLGIACAFLHHLRRISACPIRSTTRGGRAAPLCEHRLFSEIAGRDRATSRECPARQFLPHRVKLVILWDQEILGIHNFGSFKSNPYQDLTKGSRQSRLPRPCHHVSRYQRIENFRTYTNEPLDGLLITIACSSFSALISGNFLR